jgi:hypothetical protein
MATAAAPPSMTSSSFWSPVMDAAPPVCRPGAGPVVVAAGLELSAVG